MKNRRFLKILLIFCIYFLLYLIAIINKSHFWADILSPIGAVICFFVILNTYIKSSRTHFIFKAWLLLSLACLSWAVADSFWAFLDIALKINPINSKFITTLYLFPNIFLISAVITFLIFQAKRWNFVQLILDISAVCVCSLLLIWVMFFNKSIIMVLIISKDGIVSSASIIIDLMIIAAIAVWHLSTRIERTPIFACILFSGILLFTFNDIYYYYLYFNNDYIPGYMNDAFYIASFIIAALGAAWETCHRESRIYIIKAKNRNSIGAKHSGMVLLLCPSLIYIFKGQDIIDLTIALLIIIIYEGLSAHVQSTIKNKQLLQKEKELNIVLEKMIKERTRELFEKNKQLLEKNKELDFLSNQDSVTGLYNRRYFINAISENINKITNEETLAILFIDLDRFKTINDTYGHGLGDQVLIEMSKRFKKMDRENTIIARLGGDEFVFAIFGKYNYKEIEEIAEQIISCCGKELVIEQYKFHVTLSVGISMYPFDAYDCSMLMKNADMAMYHAKAQGHNKCISFNSILNEKVHRRHEIEILLKKADFAKEFKLHYQPQFSIPDRKLLGIEALLRWDNPEAGSIPPGEFIPIAEEIDYIIPIGEWVMKEAVRQIAVWNRIYSLQLKMGINISPKQLDNKKFIGKLKSELEAEFVDSKCMDIEITESIEIEDEYRISEISDLFQGVGTSISIDDFGTGYSSLSYLKMFPFDRIKIAKPMIDSISLEGYDMQIVKAIIMLAKSIGIKTIAEGVETQKQLDILIDLGCEEVQGFLLGKPMPADIFEEIFLKKIEKIV